MRRLGIRALTPALVVAVLLVATGSAEAASINEYPPLLANSRPQGIAAGPDGNIWFTEYYGSRVGRITPDGKVTDWSTGSGISTHSNLLGIASGPDGNLWFAEEVGRVGRITTRADGHEFSTGIDPNGKPFWISPGPDGNLWFTESNASKIGRITPAGTVTEFSAGITPASNPIGITAGPDGNLWFAEFAGRIGRITPAGVVTEISLGLSASSRPYQITTGPDRNLWFTEVAGNAIGRMTTGGTLTEFHAGISAGGQPTGIAVGPDGNLWFTEYVGNRIGRITPTGAVTEFSSGISAGAGPWAITVGPDGNMWFTEQDGNRLARLILDPAAVTGAASDVGTSGAVLAGTVTPFGARASYVFEYGRTTAYGSATASKQLEPGTTAVAVSAAIGGLQRGTLYHYRIVATSAGGTTRGPDATFTTTRSGAAGGGGASADRRGPRMRIASRTLTLSKGRVKIKLGCPLAETLGCHGTVGIKARRLSLGSAKFRIRGGHTRTVTVRVSKRARALVGHRVRLVVTGIDAAGNKKTTTKRMALKTP